MCSSRPKRISKQKSRLDSSQSPSTSVLRDLPPWRCRAPHPGTRHVYAGQPCVADVNRWQWEMQMFPEYSMFQGGGVIYNSSQEAEMCWRFFAWEHRLTYWRLFSSNCSLSEHGVHGRRARQERPHPACQTPWPPAPQPRSSGWRTPVRHEVPWGFGHWTAIVSSSFLNGLRLRLIFSHPVISQVIILWKASFPCCKH